MDGCRKRVETMQRENSADAPYDAMLDDDEIVVCCVDSLAFAVLSGDELRNIEVNTRLNLWVSVAPDRERLGVYQKRCAFCRQPLSAH